MGKQAQPLAERIRANATVADDGCWRYASLRTDGYGHMWVGSRTDGSRRLRRAHIVSYETFVGPVPEGMELDHLCRNLACVNPDHLEAVTAQENVRRSESPAAKNARKTACPQGHPYDADNTYRDRHGKRYCQTCRGKG